MKLFVHKFARLFIVYTHLFSYETLFFLVVVGSIHFDIVSPGIFHKVKIKNSTLYILCYNPRFSYRSSFAFADENKELNVHFQYNNCPDLTIFVRCLKVGACSANFIPILLKYFLNYQSQFLTTKRISFTTKSSKEN